jgi:hypothetical protein
VAQQVAQAVHPAALPRAALEHPLDRRRQAQVGTEITSRVPVRPRSLSEPRN